MAARVQIVFVFLAIFSQEGGIQSYVQDVLRSYLTLPSVPGDRRATDIFLLRDSADDQNPLALNFAQSAVTCHYFKTTPAWQGRLTLAAQLWQFLWQRRPQHLFCGHVNLAGLVSLYGQLLGIPYTVLTYGKEVWQPLPNLTRFALGRAASIWTISRYSRDRLCAVNGITAQKVQILPCVVDGKTFTPGRKSESLMDKYDLGDCQVLMTVARLWSGDIYKGVDVTIRALPHLLQDWPQVKYLVIGRGDDQPRLAQLAEQFGIGDRVVFAGFVPTEALIDHYRLADAYIMPSQEGFGIVYLEAMACGIPVLSGDADGSADPLQDGKVGWRVPHRDPNAVAAACREMLAGQDQRCDGRWLREQTLAQFSQEAQVKRLQALTRQLGLSPWG